MSKKSKWRFVKIASLVISIAGFLVATSTFAVADKYEDAAKKWAKEFKNSVFSEQERIDELMWFNKTAAPFRGKKLKSVAESIVIHQWEERVLTKAFKEITGIDVVHDIIGEDSVVERLQTQMATGQRIYDIYINDADLVGTHYRKGSAINLTEYMAGEGKDVTNPYLDLDDWMNAEFGQDYDGNQLQLPDQQFPALLWFRYDWFTDPKYKEMFKNKYGYELGVPLNFRAYEDIANFWTNDVQYIDGVRIYGHLEGGKREAILLVRFTDAWLSVSGMGDKGLPNGIPVDEWGIRVDAEHRPVGCMVERGGALNSPAAVYAIQTYSDWILNYAPPYAPGLSMYESFDTAGGGTIAMQVWMYACLTAGDAYKSIESPVTDENGKILWRLAPIPHGKYWEEGMKVGYQDAGSWTIPPMTKGDLRKMAWLWAQFCVSKTVSVDKFIVGQTPVRKSTVWSDWATENEGIFGGIISFYRSPIEVLYTDTGLNVPDYPLIAEQWWRNLPKVWGGQATAQEVLDEMAELIDSIMSRLFLPTAAPKLNPIKSRAYWLNQPGSPKPEILNEPKPRTIGYDELIQLFREGKVPQDEVGWDGIEKEIKVYQE